MGLASDAGRVIFPQNPPSCPTLQMRSGREVLGNRDSTHLLRSTWQAAGRGRVLTLAAVAIGRFAGGETGVLRHKLMELLAQRRLGAVGQP